MHIENSGFGKRSVSLEFLVDEKLLCVTGKRWDLLL